MDPISIQSINFNPQQTVAESITFSVCTGLNFTITTSDAVQITLPNGSSYDLIVVNSSLPAPAPRCVLTGVLNQSLNYTPGTNSLGVIILLKYQSEFQDIAATNYALNADILNLYSISINMADSMSKITYNYNIALNQGLGNFGTNPVNAISFNISGTNFDFLTAEVTASEPLPLPDSSNVVSSTMQLGKYNRTAKSKGLILCATMNVAGGPVQGPISIKTYPTGVSLP